MAIENNPPTTSSSSSTNIINLGLLRINATLKSAAKNKDRFNSKSRRSTTATNTTGSATNKTKTSVPATSLVNTNEDRIKSSSSSNNNTVRRIVRDNKRYVVATPTNRNTKRTLIVNKVNFPDQFSSSDDSEDMQILNENNESALRRGGGDPTTTIAMDEDTSSPSSLANGRFNLNSSSADSNKRKPKIINLRNDFDGKKRYERNYQSSSSSEDLSHHHDDDDNKAADSDAEENLSKQLKQINVNAAAGSDERIIKGFFEIPKIVVIPYNEQQQQHDDEENDDDDNNGLLQLDDEDHHHYQQNAVEDGKEIFQRYNFPSMDDNNKFSSSPDDSSFAQEKSTTSKVECQFFQIIDPHYSQIGGNQQRYNW